MSRPVLRRWAIAGAAVLAGSGFGFGLGTWSTEEGSARTGLVGLGFLPAKGWTIVQSTAARQEDAATAVAANVPLRPSGDPRAVVRATRASLPPNGILIFATFTARGDPTGVDFARRELPLSIERARAVSRLRAGVGAYNVDVRIYFGTASPPHETIDAAQRQLNRLVVASEAVTLVVSPRVIRNSSERLSIFGSVSSGKADETVTIQFKQCGLLPLQFRDRLETTTREGGGFSFAELRPIPFGVSGVVRAVWGDSVSAQVHVQQRASVHLQPVTGGRFEVAVSALQQFWRRQVQLQRFERRLGGWVTVRTVVLTEQLGGGGAAPPFASASPVTTKTAPFHPRLPKGTTIRAVFPLSQAQPCYLAGYSQIRRT